MTIFLSSAWVDVQRTMHQSLNTKRVALGTQEIFLGEIAVPGLKIWKLYGSPAPDDEQRPLLLALVNAAKAERVSRMECNFNMARWTAKSALAEAGTITAPFGTYRIALSASAEELWQHVHGKHRNVIRKARKSGVEIRPVLALDEFHNLLVQTYAKGNKQNHFSLSYLKTMHERLGQNLFMAGAYSQDKLQAGIIAPYDEECGYYLHGATSPDAPLGASNLLQWETMLCLKSRNVLTYDLGGARRATDDPRLAGIFRFKQRFGGEFVDCFFWETVFNKATNALYQRLNSFRKVLR